VLTQPSRLHHQPLTSNTSTTAPSSSSPSTVPTAETHWTHKLWLNCIGYWTASNDDPVARALVLTGAGSAFCAGANIKAQPDDLIDTAATPHTALQAAATSASEH
jgi:hypothetical protein